MASDTDLERRLRGALLDHAEPDGLPDRVLVDSLALGRTSLRRRRRLAAAGAVASLAVPLCCRRAGTGQFLALR